MALLIDFDFDSLAEVSNYSYHTLSYVVPGSQGFKGTHFTLLGVDFWKLPHDTHCIHYYCRKKVTNRQKNRVLLFLTYLDPMMKGGGE